MGKGILKKKLSKLQKRMRLRGLGAWGIPPGPFAACWATFVQEFFHHFHLHTGRPFLLPQRANYEKGEFLQLPIWRRQRGFSAWGIQTGPLAEGFKVAMSAISSIRLFEIRRSVHRYEIHSDERILGERELQYLKKSHIQPDYLVFRYYVLHFLWRNWPL